jgi:TRAP transporter TAXI family solute receptor
MTFTRSIGDMLRIGGPALLLAIAGFALAYQFVDPAPPSHFTIASGSESGAYFQYAQRYKDILAEDGVTVEVVSTQGSVENLELLRDKDGDVQVAFVQGGAGKPSANETLASLASLYFEPVWVFHREAVNVTQLGDLLGYTIAVGTSGSGTRALALKLLNDNGIDDSNSTFLSMPSAAAIDALFAAEVDALVLVSSPHVEAIRRLLKSDAIRLMSFERADAYTRRHRYLSSVTLPEGVVSLTENMPAQAIRLVAPAAALVAREDFHPALVDLLMAAAVRVHREGGVFEAERQFPSQRYLQFPLSDGARRFFARGPSFLRRVLPFWAATLIERTLVMLVPLIALLIPLIKIMPPVYRWRTRSRIYRWYKALLAIDPTVNRAQNPTDGGQSTQDGLNQLARIEEDIAKVNVPLAYADQLYALRVHLELVREKLLAIDNQQPRND